MLKEKNTKEQRKTKRDFVNCRRTKIEREIKKRFKREIESAFSQDNEPVKTNEEQRSTKR